MCHVDIATDLKLDVVVVIALIVFRDHGGN